MANKKRQFYGGQEVEGELPLPTKFDKDYLLFLEMNDVRKRMNNLMTEEDIENAKIHLKNFEIWVKNKTSNDREHELMDLEKRYAFSKSKAKNSKELIIIDKQYLFQKFNLLMQIVDEEITEKNITAEVR